MAANKDEQSNFRLTKEAKKMLARLAKKRGHSMTAVIETLIRDQYAKEER